MSAARLPIGPPAGVEPAPRPVEARWLTAKQLSRLLSVDVRTVRRWIKAEDQSLEILRIGGSVWVRVRPK